MNLKMWNQMTEPKPAANANEVSRDRLAEILVQEQDHQLDLATAVGEEVPDLSGPKGRTLR
jgi:hypothetical protein